MRNVRLTVSALALLGVLAAAIPAQAQFTPVNQPGDFVGLTPYVNATTLIDINALAHPNFSNFNSLADANLTLSFDNMLNARTVGGGGWSTWGSYPATETSTPRIGYNNKTSLHIQLSQAVSIFGFELEPNPFSIIPFTVTFNGTTVGAISKNVNGSAGAKLFAASTTGQITDVLIQGQSDFGVGRFRYALLPSVQSTPEPGTYAMLGGMGVSGFTFWLRRRNRKAA